MRKNNTKREMPEKRKAMTLYLSTEEEMMFRDILSRRPDLPMTKTGIVREALKEYWNKHKRA